MSSRMTSLGMHKTPEYTAWKHMVHRCTRPGDPGWPQYGARGIKVTPEWIGEGGFARFLTYIGHRPSPEHSLDRIDNDGHYEPGNVRWTTRYVQSRNTRRNVWLTYNGRTLCIADWARETGIAIVAIRGRLRRGWSVEEALGTPSGEWRIAGRRPPRRAA